MKRDVSEAGSVPSSNKKQLTDGPLKYGFYSVTELLAMALSMGSTSVGVFFP
jgi:hypothetical protein